MLKEWPYLDRYTSTLKLYSTLRWVTNMNEMSTNNVKCTWPMRDFALGTRCDLYSTCSHWGFALGETQISSFMLGVMQMLAYLDTNMLVSPNSRIGGIAQHDGPTGVFSRCSGI